MNTAHNMHFGNGFIVLVGSIWKLRLKKVWCPWRSSRMALAKAPKKPISPCSNKSKPSSGLMRSRLRALRAMACKGAETDELKSVSDKGNAMDMLLNLWGKGTVFTHTLGGWDQSIGLKSLKGYREKCIFKTFWFFLVCTLILFHFFLEKKVEQKFKAPEK